MTRDVPAGDPEVAEAEAAHESSVETAEAVEEAARVNDDPGVAEALDDASLQAGATVVKLDWLLRRLKRFFSRTP